MDPRRIELLLAGARPSSDPTVFPLRRLVANAFISAVARGAPAVVFVLSDSPGPLELNLEAFKLRVYPAARLSVNRRVRVAPIAVVELPDSSRWRLCSYLMSEMVDKLESDPKALETSRSIQDHIDDWRRSLAAIRGLSAQEVVGLWGELEILSRLPIPDRGVERWHGPEAGTFDFGGNHVLVEAKTSTVGHSHIFSWDQVRPPGTAELWVASLRIRDDPATGATVTEMADRVGAKMSSRALLNHKLMRLGLDPTAVREERYSLEDAKLVAAVDVPSVRSADPGVSSVRFTADLSGARAVTKAEERRILRRLVC